MKRLTPAQEFWLRDLAAGVSPWLRRGIKADLIGAAGRYKPASGSTHVSLFRAGLVSVLGDITPKGRARLASLDRFRPPTSKILTKVRYIGYAARLVDARHRRAVRQAERALGIKPPPA